MEPNDIASAPRDGTTLLLLSADGGRASGFWDGERWRFPFYDPSVTPDLGPFGNGDAKALPVAWLP